MEAYFRGGCAEGRGNPCFGIAANIDHVTGVQSKVFCHADYVPLLD
jgi:hypothetical protein